ncbi:hypothetical protein C8Q75DRAFT_805437 [Abortiporus biennis]|nr:hypothetical protein C8Q75DRAFT_805437 [Abortiporus biennis]
MRESRSYLEGNEPRTIAHGIEPLTSTTPCIHVLFEGAKVQIWYHQASEMIKSEILDCSSEFDQFAAIIVAFGYLNLPTCGIMNLDPTASLKSSTPRSCLLSGHAPKGQLKNDTVIAIPPAYIFEKYRPITTIISPDNLDCVFMQLIDCLEKLYENFTLHCSLSITSLMYDPICSNNGIPYLVLVDLDMSNHFDAEFDHTAKGPLAHRIGTLPFMACDILENPAKQHYLRHPLESALYIAFWITVNCPLNIGKQREVLRYWEGEILQDVHNAKTPFLQEYGELEKVLDRLSPDYVPYEAWLMALWECFQAGLHAKRKVAQALIFYRRRLKRLYKRRGGDFLAHELSQVPVETDETLYDNVTPSTLREALKRERVELRGLVESLIEDPKVETSLL